jgi:hypothetical protein
LRSEGTHHRQQRVTVQTYVDSLNYGTRLVVRLGQVEGYGNTPASNESTVVTNQLIEVLNSDTARLKTYHQWQQSRSDLSQSERLEISTTRTLYRALEKTIESGFDMIGLLKKLLKSTGIQERLKKLEK